MDQINTTSLTDYYMVKRSMDTQPSVMNLSQQSHGGLRHCDPDTDYKVRNITHLVNDSIQIAANEPSLGLYRIQEHVRRTLPNLVLRKNELSTQNTKLEDALYDLNLSTDVVQGMSSINRFTRIQQVLETAVEHKRQLNAHAEAAEREIQHAHRANKSISQNAPAEGYICPVCYFALTNQDELIAHWSTNHNLEDCDNEVFQEVEMPTNQSDSELTDVTIIEIPTSTSTNSRLSECEDVVNELNES